MSIKISELPQATSVGSSDIVPIVQGGTTKQATAGMISPTRNLAILTLQNNFEISNISENYTPKDITTMEEAISSNSNYCTYNSNNGRLTFNKNCKIKLSFSTQIRCSSESATTVVSKGFGARQYSSSGTFLNTFSIAEQSEISKYANMSGFVIVNVSVGEYLIPFGYSRNMGTGSVSEKSIIWGAGRTALAVELIEDTTTANLNSLNTTRLMNTGSLVGLGDKAEVTDETLEKTKLDETTEVKEETKEAVTEVKEEIKDEKGSGDNE